jgi:hypothetical protein
MLGQQYGKEVKKIAGRIELGKQFTWVSVRSISIVGQHRHQFRVSSSHFVLCSSGLRLRIKMYVGSTSSGFVPPAPIVRSRGSSAATARRLALDHFYQVSALR